MTISAFQSVHPSMWCRERLSYDWGNVSALVNLKEQTQSYFTKQQNTATAASSDKWIDCKIIISIPLRTGTKNTKPQSRGRPCTSFRRSNRPPRWQSTTCCRRPTTASWCCRGTGSATACSVSRSPVRRKVRTATTHVWISCINRYYHTPLFREIDWLIDWLVGWLIGV